jgi:hypothetical protein
MRAARLACVVMICVVLSAELVSAWGPHAEIAVAGAKALKTDDPIFAYLGSDLHLFGTLAWMGDYASGDGIIRIRNMQVYARDVAFYPGWTEFGHGHGAPGETGYEPVFRRMLQALHTETPINTAGWLGELIHVTQDTACPPHAVNCNDARHACENWIDATKIDIGAYEPQLLGKTDEEALQGYLARMVELHEYARVQAERALPLAAQGAKEECAAVLMESALESARVTADLLHTLGALQQQAAPRAGAGGLCGTVTPPPGPDGIVAKIMVLGTEYSTLADAEGHYEFRNLPPGPYQVAAMKPGTRPQIVEATVEADRPTRQDIDLPASVPAGNLLRNGDFSIQWMCQRKNKDIPDGWRWARQLEPAVVQWYSEPFAVKPGQTFRLTADWIEGVQAEIKIVCEGVSQAPLSAGTSSGVFTIPAHAENFRGLAWVSVCSPQPLSATFRNVAVTLEPQAAAVSDGKVNQQREAMGQR